MQVEQPTLGGIVHYHSSENTEAAIITNVVDEWLVDVWVFAIGRPPFRAYEVRFRHDDDTRRPWCEWPDQATEEVRGK